MMEPGKKMAGVPLDVQLDELALRAFVFNNLRDVELYLQALPADKGLIADAMHRQFRICPPDPTVEDTYLTFLRRFGVRPTFDQLAQHAWLHPSIWRYFAESGHMGPLQPTIEEKGWANKPNERIIFIDKLAVAHFLCSMPPSAEAYHILGVEFIRLQTSHSNTKWKWHSISTSEMYKTSILNGASKEFLDDIFATIIFSGLVPSLEGTKVIYGHKFHDLVFPFKYLVASIAGGDNKTYARSYFSELWPLFTRFASTIETHGIFQVLFANSSEPPSKPLVESMCLWNDAVVQETFLASLAQENATRGVEQLLGMMPKRILATMKAGKLFSIVVKRTRTYRPLTSGAVEKVLSVCPDTLKYSPEHRAGILFFTAYALMTQRTFPFGESFGFEGSEELIEYIQIAEEAKNNELSIRLLEWAAIKNILLPEGLIIRPSVRSGQEKTNKPVNIPGALLK